MQKAPQPKRNVYVGGLEEQVNEEILHAAFVPFGDIIEVNFNECRSTQAPTLMKQLLLKAVQPPSHLPLQFHISVFSELSPYLLRDLGLCNHS